jgi:GntR family transcriptional repressor for pyruvate dehydrogenase complex
MTNIRKTRFKVITATSSAQTTDQVVTQVSELVKREQLRPGDRLPPERELARQLGVSRPSLRAGLRSLIGMGVLNSRQGPGLLSPTAANTR